jgi:glycosyltransferase involved in cell wall biosynthesis
MTAGSPWSQAVVERLTARGLRIQVVDFSHSADSYLSANQDLASASVAALQHKVERVHIVPAPRGLLARIVGGARTLRKIARETDAELVLTLYGGVNAAIAYLSGFRPYVVYVVGSDVLLADRARYLISRVTLTAASLVLANGKYLAKKATELAPRSRVQPLYLGVDLKRFRPPPARKTAPRFVCTRGFGAVYDNVTIVRAVAQLPTLPSDFELAFLSTGPLLKAAIALADELLSKDSRGRVSFVGGTSNDAMHAALQSASFYVSASLSDGASASLMEALASGLFPILSEIPANQEWIVNGENGLLFPPGDHVALSRCIERASAGIPWMADAVETNYRLVAERANVEITMSQLSELLLERAERSPRAP